MSEQKSNEIELFVRFTGLFHEVKLYRGVVLVVINMWSKRLGWIDSWNTKHPMITINSIQQRKQKQKTKNHQDGFIQSTGKFGINVLF